MKVETILLLSNLLGVQEGLNRPKKQQRDKLQQDHPKGGYHNHEEEKESRSHEDRSQSNEIISYPVGNPITVLPFFFGANYSPIFCFGTLWLRNLKKTF